MRKSLIFIIFIFTAFCSSGQNAWIIPEPVSVKLNTGSSVLSDGGKIYSPAEFNSEVHFLQKELLRYKGVTTTIAKQETGANIVISRKPVKGFLYELRISPANIIISSSSSEGIFYGIISLLQIVNHSNNNHLPCLVVNDKPSMEWRGLMLDESRHFFGKAKVKFIIDWMAYYKLNKFHWHLTDEPGWRIEIKKYPRLSMVGGKGTFTNPEAPVSYYTQNDINEIVAYARERKIEVIPEIDMPGHATAANRAYPEFSGGGSEKHPDFTFHPAKEATYQYLTNILKEVNVLFPGRMLHLGGDEVSFGIDRWKTDSLVLKLMKEKNMTDIKGVETYFMERMADSLNSMNVKMLVWDEMVSANLSKDNTIIFWWRQDKPEQMKQSLQKGYKTVLCPRLPLYFDFVQQDSHVVGRKWAGKFNDLQSVYDYSINQLQLNTQEKSLVIGIQANVWTETIQTGQRLDYMMFPRMAAVAEAAWTTPAAKGYSLFLERLKLHTNLYRTHRIYYFNPFNPQEQVEPVF